MLSSAINASGNDTSNTAWYDSELSDLNFTFPTETNAPDIISYDTWSVTGKIVVGILLSLVIIISIGGNILVCLAIYSSRSLRKRGNVLLGSLAVADLFVSILVETFALANDLMERWIFGRKFCEVWIAFDVMCCTASILNLCAIALDRFAHIKDPMRYNRLMTRRRICLTVAFIWLLSVLMSFVPVTLGWHKPKRFESGDEQQCYLDLTPTYAVVSSSISFYLPSLVMVTLYSRLYIYAMKHVKNIRAMTTPLAKRKRSASTHSSNSLWQRNMDHKAAITLGIIMGTFLFCWFPFFCINITVAFCNECVSKFTFTCLTWLGYLNSALNPVIYSIFNVEFRKAFRRIFLVYVRGHCCFRGGLSRMDSDTSWPRSCGKIAKITEMNNSTVTEEMTLMTTV